MCPFFSQWDWSRPIQTEAHLSIIIPLSILSFVCRQNQDKNRDMFDSFFKKTYDRRVFIFHYVDACQNIFPTKHKSSPIEIKSLFRSLLFNIECYNAVSNCCCSPLVSGYLDFRNLCLFCLASVPVQTAWALQSLHQTGEQKWFNCQTCLEKDR